MKLIAVALLITLHISLSHHMETEANSLENVYSMTENGENTQQLQEMTKHRTKRGIWDIFQKMAITKNLVVDQYTDTRDTFNEVYNLFNGQFTDPGPSKPSRPGASTESPKSSDEDSQEVKTTTERVGISRYEFGRILGRNFRGLQRLTSIEFKDAFNATQYNLQEYKAEANKQFANSVAAEKKKKLKALVNG